MSFLLLQCSPKSAVGVMEPNQLDWHNHPGGHCIEFRTKNTSIFTPVPGTAKARRTASKLSEEHLTVDPEIINKTPPSMRWFFNSFNARTMSYCKSPKRLNFESTIGAKCEQDSSLSKNWNFKPRCPKSF